MEPEQYPRVSLCIPTYNQTTYLKILLESISRQTFNDYEVIISDDSSTDDVKTLVGNFGFGEKLKYTRNSPALGSPSNWNAAIKKAKGQFIKIMHHDDAFGNETALLEMMNVIEANNCDYVFADSKIENVKDSSRNRIHRISKFKRLLKKPYLLFFGNSIGGPSTLLIRKDKLGSLEYDPGYIWLVDIEYYFRLLQYSSNGAAIPQPLIITHDAAEHRLTSSILKDFELQIKEQVMLYNLLMQKVSGLYRFFMQVFVVRLFFKSKTKNKELTMIFTHVPRMVKVYFSLIKIKPLYFAYGIFIRICDIGRKNLFRIL